MDAVNIVNKYYSMCMLVFLRQCQNYFVVRRATEIRWRKWKGVNIWEQYVRVTCERTHDSTEMWHTHPSVQPEHRWESVHFLFASRFSLPDMCQILRTEKLKVKRLAWMIGNILKVLCFTLIWLIRFIITSTSWGLQVWCQIFFPIWNF